MVLMASVAATQLAVAETASVAAAPEPQWNCDDPVAQQEMNYCAAQDFHAADAVLNAQWKITAEGMKQADRETGPDFDDGRPGYFATLLEAQRAWIKYRDGQCASEGYMFRGGSLEPFIVAGCRTRLTKMRTQELRDLESAE